MSRTVSIDEMADAINEGLKEYATLASTQVKSAVRKSAKTVKDQISANAPSRTGAYKGSWVATKQSESSQSLQMVVHSKNRYQLAHLLEKGHAKRGGGRVIYVDIFEKEKLYFLFAYPKNVQTDLTEQQKKVVRQMIEAIKGE